MVDWIKGFAGAVTVCDKDGKVLEMNEQACKVFAKSGGSALIGSSLLECHPEPARSKLAEMLANPSVNAYTIEKNGVKKLIYQAPWYDNGQFGGFVEVSLPLPGNMQHFIRKTTA
ncbi:MAG: diguanylate cyclase [Candidatus Riflebacteria bacterium HGW-Riflebacteria-2]|jgi:transcriptional regulator with PAS, ATPase and Fis domain|nr:MAG: diguanylate cyclase [Candidatus Riflebacteria bacterium HGW-Riflebacteria-2]